MKLAAEQQERTEITHKELQAIIQSFEENKSPSFLGIPTVVLLFQSYRLSDCGELFAIRCALKKAFTGGDKCYLGVNIEVLIEEIDRILGVDHRR